MGVCLRPTAGPYHQRLMVPGRLAPLCHSATVVVRERGRRPVGYGPGRWLTWPLQLTAARFGFAKHGGRRPPFSASTESGRRAILGRYTAAAAERRAVRRRSWAYQKTVSR